MKRMLLCLLAGMLYGIPAAFGQRLLPGDKALQLSGGTVDGLLLRSRLGEYCWFATLSYSHTNRNRSRWVYGATFLQKDYRYLTQRVPISQYTAEAGYFLLLAADRRRNVVLWSGLSAVLGYESVNGGKRLLCDGSRLKSEGAFLYGPALSVELEGYLSDRVALTLTVRERALFGSTVGCFHTLVGIGIRITIN